MFAELNMHREESWDQQLYAMFVYHYEMIVTFFADNKPNGSPRPKVRGSEYKRPPDIHKKPAQQPLPQQKPQR